MPQRQLTSLPSLLPPALSLALLLVTTGCPEEQRSPPEMVEPEIREDPLEVPDDPSTLPNFNNPYGPSDMDMADVDPSDMGPADGGIGQQEEMGRDGGSGGARDMEPDVYDPCANPCVLGRTMCEGSQIRECQGGAGGCAVFGPPKNCDEPGFACEQGSCRPTTSCVDIDNDRYGPNCAAGADCNDNDASVHPGAAEACDGIDNDCDSQIDEGSPGTGQMCSAGRGACERTGRTICDGAGQIQCSATPGMPGAEVCNQIDDNCDGVVDDGNVCQMMPACGQDGAEPNESLATAFAFPLNERRPALICTTDSDFYGVTTQGGKVYRAQMIFPDKTADLGMRLLKDGVEVQSSRQTGADIESITWTADPGAAYAVEVQHGGTLENFYQFGIFDLVTCRDDDPFQPNQNINEAAYLLPDWQPTVYLCSGMEDWYDLGNRRVGDKIHAAILHRSTLDDFDIHLYGDPDGDNRYSVLTRSATSNIDEHVRYTSGHNGRFFLRVAAYNGRDTGRYDVFWELLP